MILEEGVERSCVNDVRLNKEAEKFTLSRSGRHGLLI